MLVALAIFLAIVALLAIPVSFRYRVAWGRETRREFRLRWLFGLVEVELPRAGGDSPAEKRAPLAKTRHREREARRKGNPAAALRHAPFRRRMLQFVRGLWRAIEKHDFRLRLRIGLGDPADTGQLWAFVGPLAGLLAGCRQAAVEIEPEFVDAVFELDSSGEIRVVPLRLVGLVLGLLLSPAAWRGLRLMRGSA